MTSSLSAILLSLVAILNGLSLQINNLQVQPATQLAQTVSSQSVSVLQSSDFTYQGFYNIRTNGEASTYGRSLTHRYVNGELRFLTIAHPNVLHEFKISNTAFGGTVTETTAEWVLPSGMVDDFTGIWYEQDKNRLWVTRTLDYGEASAYYPTRISVITLGTSGSVTNVKSFSLANIPSKQVFGGAQKLPTWAQQQFGCGPYVVGWGGYTSLVDQTSKASVGPAMFCIPDPDTISNGSTLSTSQYKTLLSAVGDRGYRITAPINEVDEEPKWRNKTPEGYSYWTWSDSYYNTGMWIEGSTKRGYVAVGSFGKGRVRYADGGVQTDGQNYELHIWNPTRLSNGLLTRPDSMHELSLPRGNTRSWTDYGVGKVTGATYDSVTGKMYLIGFPFGSDDYTGRLYVYNVNAGSAVTPTTPTTPTVPTTPTPTPTNAVVSVWSAWTDTSGWTTCSAGTQTKTQQRTRTVITQATNGGTTPELTETQTLSQTCTVVTQPTTPTPTPTTPAPTPTTPTSQNKFVIGDTVKTTSLLSVRVSPDSTRLTSQRSGSYGTIVDGPVSRGAYVWWKVDYSTGSDGWSVQNYLEKAPIPSTPTPTPTPTNAVVSVWSAWTDTSGWTTCSAGTQTKTQQRTRTVVTPATNGGTTPELTETQTLSQTCTVVTQPTTSTSPETSSNAPSGYTMCSGEGGNCNFSGTNSVAYGANGVFVYKDVTGGVYCDNSVFGDPIQNEYKYCSVKSITSTPTSPVPTTPSIPQASQITQNLYFGLSSSQVKILQDFLISKGYLSSGLNTGYFGFSTLNSVKAFQKSKGISATGYVGSQTRSAINSEI